MLQDALRKGIQVEVHAIGDRANRTILDWYEKAFDETPMIERQDRSDPRWRVEHAQIVHPDDIPRFAKLKIIPSMQPSHAIGDLHFAPSRVGVKRLAGAYAWQSFLKQGNIIAGGSDAPVERGEPMIEFYAAVARKDQESKGGAALFTLCLSFFPPPCLCGSVAVLFHLEGVFVGRERLVKDVVFDRHLNVVEAGLEVFERDHARQRHLLAVDRA
jgi:predicted amidohydrolase YtcJ